MHPSCLCEWSSLINAHVFHAIPDILQQSVDDENYRCIFSFKWYILCRFMKNYSSRNTSWMYLPNSNRLQSKLTCMHKNSTVFGPFKNGLDKFFCHFISWYLKVPLSTRLDICVDLLYKKKSSRFFLGANYTVWNKSRRTYIYIYILYL